ncbi:ribonuclease R [Luteolibacter pohnpeiensis]|uniref:Ribonuclease R n=1 Tax=Luteolibacter pohnpeiensis TaxID=454153 RepID=A0A934VS98_9BACT|nr:ribonuclease R [Luteolibacter pohnpeiensis]MBK1884061.1 ribonuclease R [Luteolibacter pohnpeiensis]
MSGENLSQSILDLIGSPGARPMTKSEIARKLGIPPKHRAAFRGTLDALVENGKITSEKKGLYQARVRSNNRLAGTLKFHPKGHGMFFPDMADEQNAATGIDLVTNNRIMINRRDTGTALDGDRVLVTIERAHARRPFRTRQEMTPEEPELRAKVEKVLARRSNRVVGVFRSKGKYNSVETDDKAIEGLIDITGDTTAQPGQLVVVDLSQWKDRNSTPRGRVIEVLGWPGDPGVDIISVIHRFGLRTSFPDDVLDEARSVPETPEDQEIARREDWRDKLVITIDPADAKDHDDAIWLKRNKNSWTLAVHIADVSHYVKPGTRMDKEASERGNSTYLVDRVLPMLPTELSNGICSLKPDVDRLTKCALMEIAFDGRVLKATFFDAVIHSRAKLSYEQAQTILDGKPAPKGSARGLAVLVREGWKLASAMRKRRFAFGALDLEMPEIKVKLDENGHAVSSEPVIHTESHQLIEECMLAANEAVAKVLRERQKPSIFRIHEDPDPSRLMDYTENAKLHGYKPGDLTNKDHIQKLLDAAKGTPEEHVIKLGLLKSLKRAAYSAEPLGHYGLSKADYTHFTSPIRRYADLVVHRSLQPFLKNPPKPVDRTPSQADLREFARHISDTERTSAEAESETKQIKLLEYLQHVLKTEDERIFDGLITDVRPMGLMVEIPDMGVRGAVKREDLPKGRWRFEQHRMAWVSSEGNVIQLGMRIPLRITSINTERRFVDFAVAGKPTTEGTHTPSPKGKGKATKDKGAGKSYKAKQSSQKAKTKKSGVLEVESKGNSTAKKSRYADISSKPFKKARYGGKSGKRKRK